MIINKNVIDMLKNSNNVAIFVHINPDGDCLGSAVALKEALKQINKNVDIYCDDNINENYAFLKDINLINTKTVDEYDLAVAVDCSDLARMGDYAKLFKSIKNSIKIDHHKTKEDFANINVVENVSSTCLILYYYILEFANINSDIACALYAGISSDTGCFMHSNTSYLEHEVSGQLLKHEFDLEKVNYYLFKRRTLNQTKLVKIAYESIGFYLNNKVGVIAITQKDFHSTNTNRSDTMGLTSIVTNIDGIEVGVVLCEEKKGLFSCSFRSNGLVDVSLVAREFGGGGHERAAGCNIFGHLNSVIKKIVSAVEKYSNLKTK